MSQSLSQLTKELRRIANKERIPLFGTFELTSRCNLECVMCYLRKDSNDKSVLNNELTTKQWLEIALQARNEGMLYVLLTGGEIFLRPDFKEIYLGMTQMGLLITLYTNGTMITEEIAEWLGKNPPRKISITVYGASNETYEKITGQCDGFAKVSKTIKLLQKQKINVELKTIIIEGLKNDLINLYEYAQNQNISFSFVNYVFPTREDTKGDPLANRVSPSDLAKIEANLENYIVKKKCNQIKHINSDIKSEEKKQLKSYYDSRPSNNFNCGAGTSSFWINWDGSMTPCGIMTIPNIDVRSHSFSDAWLVLCKKVLEIPKCSECESCDYKDFCLSCPARLFIENNRFDLPSDYLCEHVKNGYQINVNKV